MYKAQAHDTSEDPLGLVSLGLSERSKASLRRRAGKRRFQGVLEQAASIERQAMDIIRERDDGVRAAVSGKTASVLSLVADPSTDPAQLPKEAKVRFVTLWAHYFISPARQGQLLEQYGSQKAVMANMYEQATSVMPVNTAEEVLKLFSDAGTTYGIGHDAWTMTSLSAFDVFTQLVARHSGKPAILVLQLSDERSMAFVRSAAKKYQCVDSATGTMTFLSTPMTQIPKMIGGDKSDVIGRFVMMIPDGQAKAAKEEQQQLLAPVDDEPKGKEEEKQEKQAASAPIALMSLSDDEGDDASQVLQLVKQKKKRESDKPPTKKRRKQKSVTVESDVEPLEQEKETPSDEGDKSLSSLLSESKPTRRGRRSTRSTSGKKK